MMEQLYRKVLKGKVVRYEPVEAVEAQTEPTIYYNLDEQQSLTAAGSLGVILLMLFERHVPPHKRVARKIKAVETAILDLYKGTGKEIDNEVADAVCRAWDKAMKLISAEEGI